MAANDINAGSRTQSVLHFAKWLQHALDRPSKVLSTLTTHLEALTSSPLHDATHEEHKQLHQAGVELWNKCRRECTETTDQSKTLLAQVRAFAYLILSRPSENVAIRTARACVNATQYPLALTILERISDSLSHDYVLLRILLAWKQNTSSVADLFFAKLGSLDEETHKEDAIALFYEIGIDHLEKNDSEEAKKWLEKAYNILQEWDWQSSFDGPEMRLNIWHTYTRCLFAVEDNSEEARNMLASLGTEYPQRLPILLLKMEQHTDAEELCATLETTIQCIQLIDSNIKLIIHYIHVLRKLNMRYACTVLADFVLKRLIPERMQDWVETATLTLIWVVASDHDAQGTPETLEDSLGTFSKANITPLLSPNASQGAIMLIWRRIEQAFDIDVQVAARWCKFALKLASQADLDGGQYQAKLSRKLVACCLASEDYTTAQYALENLPESAKTHQLTLYLAYVVAIRIHNSEAAEKALSSLASASKDADKLLFACVSETEKNGNARFQVKLLQRILDKYSNGLHLDINISALLRATARLLWQLLEQDKDDVDKEILERLCAVLRAAKNHSIRCNSEIALAGQTFSVTECEWFSKNGYNLALQMVQRWPAACVVKILENIANIRYPNQIDDNVQQRHSQRQGKIAFARIILYTTEARDGDVTTYTKVMTVYESMRQSHSDLFRPLLPIIFEAAIHSGLPDRQSRLVDILTSISADSPKANAACADLVLSAATRSDELRLDTKTTVELLNQIISHVRFFPGYDIAQASRWIRCIVQLIVHNLNIKQNDKMGLAVLKETLEEAVQIMQDPMYPQEELEWLATTTFNFAVDMFIAEKDETGREMARRALTFAQAMEDKGLERMLQGKMRKIGWA